mgnify:FL=1
MPIPADNPLVIPAKPAEPGQTLAYLWIKNITIRMPSATSGRASLIFEYYDPDTGDIVDTGNDQQLRIGDLPKAIAEVPEAAAAMTAIIAAVEPLQAWVASQTTTPDPNPED